MNEISKIIYSCENFLNSCDDNSLINNILNKVLLTIYNISTYTIEDVVNILLFLLNLQNYNLNEKNKMILDSIISKIKIIILEKNENQYCKKVNIFSSLGKHLGFSHLIDM